ncbi:hypothetical protein BZM27_25670 [Paraburkholderia steynii]|uniref:Uncharacterized protein n=1 Tax=Paraburkholderia steynii TaxID=1245441 RepID=A0A4R0X8H5_9BURK|nr:hypothetical protein BZM27_25670 [Paraburkholderia steynii]
MLLMQLEASLPSLMTQPASLSIARSRASADASTAPARPCSSAAARGTARPRESGEGRRANVAAALSLMLMHA